MDACITFTEAAPTGRHGRRPSVNANVNVNNSLAISM